MSAQTTLINVSATDNELYLIASTGAGSSEIVHIKSGYNNPVSYQVVPQSILAPGNYNLTMVGINWGGPTNFKVTLTTGGAAQSYGASSNGASAPVGVFWTQSIAITV